MNVAKDILYIDAPDAYDRRAIQTVFYETLVKLTKVLTPIIPHTAEELWAFLNEEEEYAQLSEMPVVEKYENRQEVLERWTQFMDLRDNILKANEVDRKSTRLNSSHVANSYAVFCLKKKKILSLYILTAHIP